MSQKSNILTIRFPDRSLNLDIKNPREFLRTYKLLKILKQSLNKKGILLTHSTIKVMKANYFVKLKVFFGTHQLVRYKTFLQSTKVKNKKINFIQHLIQHTLGCKTLITDIAILNHLLINKQTKMYFNEFKRFKNILFSRQFSLFIDFIKLTNLFTNEKISAELYLQTLGKIFRKLPKNKHTRYFFFLSSLFKLIVQNSQNSISGIKLEVSGKLKGKLRSSSEQISKGNISNPSISKSVYYSRIHIYTIYGSFGMKL